MSLSYIRPTSGLRSIRLQGCSGPTSCQSSVGGGSRQAGSEPHGLAQFDVKSSSKLQDSNCDCNRRRFKRGHGPQEASSQALLSSNPYVQALSTNLTTKANIRPRTSHMDRERFGRNSSQVLTHEGNFRNCANLDTRNDLWPRR